MGGLAYLAVGLALALTIVRVVHSRGRRVRGGRVTGVLLVLFWPIALGLVVLALGVGAIVAWVERNS